MTSVYLDETHDAFRASVRRFMEHEVAPHADEWETSGRIPRAIWPRMGELGLLGVTAPESVGGAGADLFTALVLLEELPRSLMGGFCAAVSVQQFVATQHILHWGSDALKERYVRPSVEGRAVGALGVTEPDAGSDVAALRTRAVRDGAHWVVDGAKTFITNGADGDFVTLAVRTRDEPGPGGISLLVVDSDLPGFTVARRLDKLGWHASDTAELHFEGVRVPADRLVGEEGMGFYYLMEAFQLERLVGAAAAVGGADLALEKTFSYLTQRHAFGRPLIRYQALSHRLAELAAEVEAGRQLVYHAAWLMEQGDGAVRECSMAKLVAGELGVRVADACLQCFGGYGYMEEYPLARFLRDARAGTIAGGTSEVMREILARVLAEGRVPEPVGRRAPRGAGEPAPTPVEKPEAPVPGEAAPEAEIPMTVEGLVGSLPQRLRPDRAEGWRAVFHFVLSGAERPEWTVVIEDGRCRVEPGLEGAPDCVVRMSADTYVGIESGSVNPQTAFMMGRVKVSDVGQMMRYVKAFRPAGGGRP